MKRFLLKWAALCAVCLVTLGASAQDDTPDYLCFTANTDGSTVELTKYGAPTAVTIQYQKNGTEGSWTDVNFSNVTTTGEILLNAGEKVYFRNASTTGATGFSTKQTKYYYFVMEGSIAASGNVLSLMDQSCSITDISSYKYCFLKLFAGCVALTSAPELPATKLSSYCYYQMFKGCTNLTCAPELPASTLAGSCYHEMFYDCEKLNVVKVAFTSFGEGTSTTQWLWRTSVYGFFICPDELDTSIKEENYAPNWYVNGYPLTVPATGWASMYLPIEVTIPEGVKAYYASAASKTVVTLKPITGTIPAGTAVIVKAAEGTVTFPYTSTAADPITDNLFEGNWYYGTKCDANSVYVLNATTSTPDMPMLSNYTGTTLGSFKAYLPKSAVGGASSIQFRFDDATAISTVEMENGDDALYNMAGQRVSSDYRGIVIKNGKKMWNN